MHLSNAQIQCAACEHVLEIDAALLPVEQIVRFHRWRPWPLAVFSLVHE